MRYTHNPAYLRREGRYILDTPGQIRLYSLTEKQLLIRLKSFGYNPFPIREDVLQPVQESGEFPLFLTTGSNLLSYLHWQYRYIPRLRKMSPEPLFEIHPKIASQYDISDGEMAEVQTTYGKIQLKAHVTPGIRQDTINIPQGWEEANANELTGTEDPDSISGFPNLKSLKCRIQKM